MPSRPPAAPSVLALLPSEGLGGGIESYWAALAEALVSLGAELQTVSLGHAPNPRLGASDKAAFVARAVAAARGLRRHAEAVLLVLHPGLVPAGLLAQRAARVDPGRCWAFFYGADIWGTSRMTVRLVRRAGWRVATISSFSAGALAGSGPVTVLPPGIPERRYDTLLAARSHPTTAGPFDVLTVIRLAHAQSKGAHELLHAGDLVRETGHDLSLVIAGSGDPPAGLRAAVACRPWARIEQDLEFPDLAALYHRARLFVLATRSHQPGIPGFSGEGFGIVLAEAQLAGTPVIAPVLGGSTDAFVEGFTGLRPVDGSAEALADRIRALLGDPPRLEEMASRAACWGRACFSPDAFRATVGDVVLAPTRRGDRHAARPVRRATGFPRTARGVIDSLRRRAPRAPGDRPDGARPAGHRDRHDRAPRTEPSPTSPARVVSLLCAGLRGTTLLNVGAGSTGHASSHQRVVNVDRALPPSFGAGLFVRADALALPFRHGSFDGVLMKDVVEHVPDSIAALEEAHRVSAPGADLILVTPRAVPRAVWDDPTHVRGFTARALLRTLSSGGWQPTGAPRRMGGFPGAGRLRLEPHLETIMRIPGLGHWFGTNWIVRAISPRPPR